MKAFGPGLEPTGCIVDRPAEFTIDARAAGKGDLKLYAQVGHHCPHCALLPHIGASRMEVVGSQKDRIKSLMVIVLCNIKTIFSYG